MYIYIDRWIKVILLVYNLTECCRLKNACETKPLCSMTKPGSSSPWQLTSDDLSLTPATSHCCALCLVASSSLAAYGPEARIRLTACGWLSCKTYMFEDGNLRSLKHPSGIWRMGKFAAVDS